MKVTIPVFPREDVEPVTDETEMGTVLLDENGCIRWDTFIPKPRKVVLVEVEA